MVESVLVMLSRTLQRSVISAGVLHRLPSERATEPFALLRVLRKGNINKTVSVLQYCALL